VIGERLTNQSPIHVLVVEDELFNRLHAVDLVERAGYKAVEAANAGERGSQFWRHVKTYALFLRISICRDR
jgi:two-component system, response regulator PdtaR